MPAAVDYFLNTLAWGLRKETSCPCVDRGHWVAVGGSNMSTQAFTWPVVPAHHSAKTGAREGQRDCTRVYLFCINKLKAILILFRHIVDYTVSGRRINVGGIR